MKNKLIVLLAAATTSNLFSSVVISGTNPLNTNTPAQTTGLITQSSVPTSTPFTLPTITPYTPPVITPVTTPTITPVTSPAITPITTPTITPATTPTITPVNTSTATVTPPPSVKVTPPVHTPITDSKKNEPETKHSPVVITNNDKQNEKTSDNKDVTSVSSPYKPNLGSDSTQINLNAPVPTIKIGEKFVFVGPAGSKIHPTSSDLDTKLKADKRADSTIENTVITSESDDNGSKLTVTGQRSSMPSEPPYPIIVEETKNGRKKFTTIARIRVVK